MIWLVFTFTITVSAETYEVAQRNPQASDSGGGTTEQPWKTISKAANTVKPGDKVIICDGVYREGVVVKTSGTAQAPIIFETAPGAHVVITGADHLVDWQKTPDRKSVV